MIDFPRSFFTWKTFPRQADPYYKYAGGFIGKDGDVRRVRFNIESGCVISAENGAALAELFVGAPCRTEYTIPRQGFFQLPSSEFRMAFSRTHRIPIARRPSGESEPASAQELSEAFQDCDISLKEFPQPIELNASEPLIEATLANALLNARCAYRDEKTGLRVTVEYPVNLINVNREDAAFQVCTGPLVLPDLATWNGRTVHRVFLAHVAFTAFDYIEFILRREVAAASEELVWLHHVEGRDRNELRDPNNKPPGYPPPRPSPTVYSEVWALPSTNTVLRAPNL
ncbi:MAG: hypothetical protein F4X14_14620 [Caldilineaceae bacterium SB0661_bin_32]|uniref:Uncharacterized protein n=1 Tax=Caldilineaceae bacterium SB0661_bin_32 TaxID=2605255 RepID=A0A6B1D9D1_9CHLR|nr:hypothetical protein [Caldilineaceae bacterium SB0661_bin_32]